MAGSVASANPTGTGGGFLVLGVSDPEAYKASNPLITFRNSETRGYNILEVTRGLLARRRIPVNLVKQRPGLRAPLRAFTVPKDRYWILCGV